MKFNGRTGAFIKGFSLFLALFLSISLPQAVPAADEMKEVALDFDDVDIRLFIRVISEMTGKNFIIDNNVRGKVTVLSPKKLTTKQAYEVFQSVLAVNGFALVETGEITKVVPAQNMTGYGLPLSTKRTLKGEDKFITQIIPLKYLDAKGLQPLVKPLLSRQATVLVPPSSDLLVVTDYKANIRKVEKVLDEIDIEISDQVIEMLEIHYSSSTTISSKVTEILEAKYGKNRQGTRPVTFKIVPIDRTNSVIAVASPDVLMEIRSLLKKIDNPTPEGKSLINVYYLENAKAEDVVGILTETQKAMASSRESEVTKEAPKTEAGGVVTGGKFKALGKEITITADKATNSIIIYAEPDDYNEIEKMIKMLDIPRRQVFLKALIMEVSPNEDFNFGTEWSGFRDVGHPLSNQSRAGVVSGAKSSGGALDTLLAGGDIGGGFSLGMLGESVSVGDFTFPSFSVLIKAVESLNTTNILSKPQLMTLNNEPATINISTNRPFQTTSTILDGGGTSQNIEYRDVGIILGITPYINKGGKVKLEINLEVSKLSGTVAENQPITLKRTIETVVEVPNNGTIVIGGLIEEQRDFSKDTVPCLGGLPFVGWGFKTIGVSDTRTNLLVFINPQVIVKPEDIEAITIEKRKHMEKERAIQKDGVENEQPFFMEYAPKSKRKTEENEQKGAQ